MTSICRARQRGFTLVEVLVTLVLFSLIGVAGFSLVDGLIRVQYGTEGRLERLAELQRGMHVMTLDFEQISSDALAVDGNSVSFRRISPSGGDLSVRYDLIDGNLRRTLSERFGNVSTAQGLVSSVQALDWQFYLPELGWQDSWPPESTFIDTRPTAIAVDLILDPNAAGLSGSLRRVVQLPARFNNEAR